jgi:hypothetical protein
MSASRSVPAARTVVAVALVSAALAALAGVACGYTVGARRADAPRDVLVSRPATQDRVAFVREGPCGTGRCQTLWLGNSTDDASLVATLTGAERCEEIAWSPDGYRMGFLVNGYELRVFDSEPRTQVTQINLVHPDGVPSSRIARGVTFSPNGLAVTFDECPRHTSGCKSGLAGIRIR